MPAGGIKTTRSTGLYLKNSDRKMLPTKPVPPSNYPFRFIGGANHVYAFTTVDEIGYEIRFVPSAYMFEDYLEPHIDAYEMIYCRSRQSSWENGYPPMPERSQPFGLFFMTSSHFTSGSLFLFVTPPMVATKPAPASLPVGITTMCSPTFLSSTPGGPTVTVPFCSRSFYTIITRTLPMW